MKNQIETDWTKPQPIDAVSMAFGGSMDRLLPAWDDIPEDFRKCSAQTKWHKAQSQWFFCGLKGAVFTPKAGIDQNTALRHLMTIQGSFEPKHEHKEAAVAWLMSLWFDDIKIQPPEMPKL